MSDILNKVRKLNWLLQESPTGVFSFNEMCGILSDLMDANVYVANDRGKVIGVNYKIKSDSPTIACLLYTSSYDVMRLSQLSQLVPVSAEKKGLSSFPGHI